MIDMKPVRVGGVPLSLAWRRGVVPTTPGNRPGWDGLESVAGKWNGPRLTMPSKQETVSKADVKT